jgi:hypothetical protein
LGVEGFVGDAPVQGLAGLVVEFGTDLAGTTCRFCRAELGLDDHTESSSRLEVLFVPSLTLDLRPGELRKLAWEHVDLAKRVIHV